jgi:hypothetical protein
MENLSVRKQATLPLTLIIDDGDDAISAKITISKDDVIYREVVAAVATSQADLTLDTSDTDLPLGIYDYMITITYTGGVVEKLPETDGCDDCELPTLEICEANDVEVS